MFKGLSDSKENVKPLHLALAVPFKNYFKDNKRSFAGKAAVRYSSSKKKKLR